LLAMAGSTNTGLKRKDNQDRCLMAELDQGTALVAVADGVGGHAGGAVAAQTAIEKLERMMENRPSSLNAAFLAACQAVEQKGARHPDLAGMSTTMTTAVIGQDLMEWCHLGDTRLYLFRDNILARLTRDDTAAEELVEAGYLSIEEARQHPARHMLYECLGCGDCEPSSGQEYLLPGDLIMVSSDGLHGELSDQKISALLAGNGSLDTKISSLINGALEAGGHDNITVVLVRV